MIGDLYDARNVKVGQAALLVAPANTPNVVPSATAPVMSDPFSLAPWSFASLTASATLTAGNFTLTYTLGGRAYTTSSLAYNATNAAIASAIVTALAPLGALASDVSVAGGPLPGAGTVTITLTERLQPEQGTWSITPTGITGGTLTITGPVWNPVGATDQGWTWASAKTLQDITIEEQSTLVGRLIASQQITVTGALSEDISNTLALAFNMTVAATAQTSTVPSYETLTLTDNVQQYAIALIMANAVTVGGGSGGYPRWLYIPQVTCLDNVSVPFRRAAAKRMYTAQFTSVCATNLITVTNITGPHN